VTGQAGKGVHGVEQRSGHDVRGIYRRCREPYRRGRRFL
jgi:hypothetical protein